jgi:hypothetical protein
MKTDHSHVEEERAKPGPHFPQESGPVFDALSRPRFPFQLQDITRAIDRADVIVLLTNFFA